MDSSPQPYDIRPSDRNQHSMNNQQIPTQQSEEKQSSLTIPSMNVVETIEQTIATANPYGVSLFPIANDSESLPGQTRLHWFFRYGESFGELSNSDKDDFERSLFVYAGILPMLGTEFPSSHLSVETLREIYQDALFDFLKKQGCDDDSIGKMKNRILLKS